MNSMKNGDVKKRMSINKVTFLLMNLIEEFSDKGRMN